MTFREKLEMWHDNPNTESDAWMRLSFPKIEKHADVNPHNACVQLPKIIAERTGKTEAEVRETRMLYRYDNGLAKHP